MTDDGCFTEQCTGSIVCTGDAVYCTGYCIPYVSSLVLARRCICTVLYPAHPAQLWSICTALYLPSYMDRRIGIVYGRELSLPLPACSWPSVFRAQAGPCLVCRRISELLAQGESEVLCTFGCRLSDDDWSRAATDRQDIQCSAVPYCQAGREGTLRRLQMGRRPGPLRPFAVLCCLPHFVLYRRACISQSMYIKYRNRNRFIQTDQLNDWLATTN